MRVLVRPVAFCLLSLLARYGFANNIQVINAALTGNTSTSAQVQFDLSWENSWRGGGVANWDAAWVFVKYRTLGGLWQHAQLSNTGHVAPAGSQIDPGLLTPGTAYNAGSNPVVGVFVYRNTPGTGTLSLPVVQLLWNYSAQGLAYNDITAVQVFAIEMVNVPQGSFAAGNSGTEAFAFALTTINTSNPMAAPSGSGSLGGQAGGYPTGQTAPTSFTWPNGYSALYCMKYEVSQQAYVDLLNTLTLTQQAGRVAIGPASAPGTGALIVGNSNRNGIDIQTSGVSSTNSPAVYACNLDGDANYGEADDGKDIACNYLSWGDLAAYLDWSGLRPMTEMEFEKACRGTILPLPNEYPWGTAGIAGGPYTLANAGANNEGIATNYSTTSGNASYNITVGAIDGPMRVGIFAANGGNSGRVTAGATYYGIMQMGDNLFEKLVTIGNVNGRAFSGTHGNGVLAASGDPDVATWPAASTADGAGWRGTAYTNTFSQARISDRQNATFLQSIRNSAVGGRGVRSSP